MHHGGASNSLWLSRDWSMSFSFQGNMYDLGSVAIVSLMRTYVQELGTQLGLGKSYLVCLACLLQFDYLGLMDVITSKAMEDDQARRKVCCSMVRSCHICYLPTGAISKHYQPFRDICRRHSSGIYAGDILPGYMPETFFRDIPEPTPDSRRPVLSC